MPSPVHRLILPMSSSRSHTRVYPAAVSRLSGTERETIQPEGGPAIYLSVRLSRLSHSPLMVIVHLSCHPVSRLACSHASHLCRIPPKCFPCGKPAAFWNARGQYQASFSFLYKGFYLSAHPLHVLISCDHTTNHGSVLVSHCHILRL